MHLRRLLAAGLALCCAAAQAQPPAPGSPGRVPLPVLQVDRTTTCVAPPEVMRREHARMLAQRKELVRQGVRGGPQALQGCLECHADRRTGVAAGTPQAFCQACHDFVAVRLDCFACHQPAPGAVARR